jgi:5-formyltetrahydrofolate cyclo-ligase
VDQKQSKAELRRSLLKIRQSMSVEEWREKSDRLVSHLQSSLTQPQTILAYFSFRQEPDLSLLFTETQHRWGFPRCQNKSLSWHLWKPGEPLQAGAYGILTPHADAPTLRPSEVDLILVPAVACDVQGYRLGYGGGFYDRMLSQSPWASQRTVGIVFEFAYVPSLPVEAWDIRLQGVCTEQGLSDTAVGY